jgi:hypothetical protein
LGQTEIEEPSSEKRKEEGESGESKHEADMDKIKAINYMVDEFTNIVGKNFGVYGQYSDFSFASSRSAEDLKKKLAKFFT